MIEERYGTLGGLTYPCLVYADYAEADAVVKNGILKHGNASLAYRGTSNDARDIVCEMLEAAGHPMKSFDKNGNETTVEKEIVDYEKPQAFIKRVCASQGWLREDGSPDLTRFQSEYDELCRKGDDGKPLAVDLTERVRQPRKARKLPDSIIEKVGAIYDGPNRARFIAAVAAKIGITLDVTDDRESDVKRFAYAALDYDRKVRAEAAEQAKKELFA